jgi:hypothetical protein
VFDNNKPWVTSDLRKEIVEKHKCYGKENYKEAQHRLNCKIKEAKMIYKRKVENLFRSNNPRDAWKGLKELTGIAKKQKQIAILKEVGSADRLNRFYSRFDSLDFSHLREQTRVVLQQAVNNSDFRLSEPRSKQDQNQEGSRTG